MEKIEILLESLCAWSVFGWGVAVLYGLFLAA
jgi:hypothetical protein